MKKVNGHYSDLFIRFLWAFGVKGASEYEKLSPAEQKICDLAYVKDLPNLLRKKSK